MSKTNIILFITILALTGCSEDRPNIDDPISGYKSDTVSTNTIHVNSEEENIFAEEIYQNCKGCHGSQAEKNALGKSKVIASWSGSKIEQTLLDYKYRDRNQYGLGGVMQGQVNGLSDYEIKIVSSYVAAF